MFKFIQLQSHETEKRIILVALDCTAVWIYFSRGLKINLKIYQEAFLQNLNSDSDLSFNENGTKLMYLYLHMH